MKSEEFNDLFDQDFAKPLLNLGFSYVRRSKTLKYINGENELQLKRLGGRLSRPGTMVSVICFRHTFLRPTQCDDPFEELLEVSDFTRKLTFQDFRGIFRPKLNYIANNSGHYEYDTFNYEKATASNVKKGLRDLVRLVEKRVLPWTNSLTPETELAQILKFGEQAWCEKRWIEDYGCFLNKTRT
jgi:hypothetical protein